MWMIFCPSQAKIINLNVSRSLDLIAKGLSQRLIAGQKECLHGRRGW